MDEKTYVVKGSVPLGEWREFLGANLVLKNGRPMPIEFFECPPCAKTFGEGKLIDCRVIIHADGGAEIHCIYDK